MNAPLRPTDLVHLPLETRLQLNGALKGARNATMLALIGNPRTSYDDTCRSPQDPVIHSLMVTEDVGPFRVTGLAPAVETLRAICHDIAAEVPQVHAILGNAGMLCCRLVRGSATAISNHSWGTAVDLTLDGHLDAPGNDTVQAGLLDIHPIFNRHGFYWGASFRREDAMHFEASEQLIEAWARAGRFGPQRPSRRPGLTIGDRGPAVEQLQLALNRLSPPVAGLQVDGIFGRDTRAAVAAFQRDAGLPPDGIASRRTRAALGLSD